MNGYKELNEKHDSFTTTGKLIAEAIVKALEAKGVQAEITTTYLDAGQNWTWDTILVQAKNGKYQALNPRQFKDMNDGTFDYSEVNQLVNIAVNFQ